MAPCSVLGQAPRQAASTSSPTCWTGRWKQKKNGPPKKLIKKKQLSNFTLPFHCVLQHHGGYWYTWNFIKPLLNMYQTWWNNGALGFCVRLLSCVLTAEAVFWNWKLKIQCYNMLQYVTMTTKLTHGPSWSMNQNDSHDPGTSSWHPWVCDKRHTSPFRTVVACRSLSNWRNGLPDGHYKNMNGW